MPPSKLHQAPVVVNRDAGKGYFRLVLKAPQAAKAARPGQFIMLRVADGMDPLLARPFGISAVLPHGAIELYYRVVGKGTSILMRVRPGQALTLTGPLGNGFPAPAHEETPLLVAGGSGFPPLLFFAAKHGKNAHLFAGSRDKACLPPAAAMQGFRSRVRKVHYATEDGSCGTCGFVTDALAAYLERALAAVRPVIYACGPRPMLAAIARLADERSVPCYVSTEERMACGLGVCMGCAVPMTAGGYKRACAEGPVFDAREIDWREHMVVPVNTVSVKREA